MGLDDDKTQNVCILASSMVWKVPEAVSKYFLGLSPMRIKGKITRGGAVYHKIQWKIPEPDEADIQAIRLQLAGREYSPSGLSGAIKRMKNMEQRNRKRWGITTMSWNRKDEISTLLNPEARQQLHRLTRDY